MKRIFFILLVLFTASCGVGNYTLSSGKSDMGALSFSSDQYKDITVLIDNDSYSIKSVKDKAYKTDRKIRPTAENTLYVTPGTHTVKVMIENEEIYSKQLYISVSEHRIVEL